MAVAVKDVPRTIEVDVAASATATDRVSSLTRVLYKLAVTDPERTATIVDAMETLVRGGLSDTKAATYGTITEDLAEDSAAEDEADSAAIKAEVARLASGDEIALPAEIAYRLANGESPVKVLRGWRGLMQGDVASKAGITQGALSDIERGRREPSMKVLHAIARALDVPASALVRD
jgi:DNA-binding XRE family transcriptional regulator